MIIQGTFEEGINKHKRIDQYSQVVASLKSMKYLNINYILNREYLINERISCKEVIIQRIFYEEIIKYKSEQYLQIVSSLKSMKYLNIYFIIIIQLFI